jgi:glucan endo-1,3-alpha-glucosidase
MMMLSIPAAASPWFFTHYGPDTFSKNWVSISVLLTPTWLIRFFEIFYSDFLWTDRWEQVLQIAPQFVEIITWNGNLFYRSKEVWN